MIRPPILTLLVIVPLLMLGGCATRPINPPITQADPSTGYRFETRQALIGTQDALGQDSTIFEDSLSNTVKPLRCQRFYGGPGAGSMAHFATRQCARPIVMGRSKCRFRNRTGRNACPGPVSLRARTPFR